MDHGSLSYFGTLNNRYYFLNRLADDGHFHEYNRETNETATLSLPEDDYSLITPFETMNDKLYFAGQPLDSEEYGLISYDGNVFETIPQPAPIEFRWHRYYYSISQNLMYLRYYNYSLNKSMLFTYDGTQFNQIPIPENLIMGSFMDEFNSKILIVMGDTNNNDTQLYESDGNTLTLVNAGQDKAFSHASPEYKANKRYYNYTIKSCFKKVCEGMIHKKIKL